jgi:hypothetical protein
VVALAEYEESGRPDRRQHLRHGLRLQLRRVPVAALRGAVEHHEGRNVAPAAADDDGIAPALAHAHQRDALRRDATVRPEEIEGRVDDAGDLVVGQRRPHLAPRQRRAVALPAREQVRGERNVAVAREPLREIQRVLHQAVALVQDHDRAGGRLPLRQVKDALAVAAETDPRLAVLRAHLRPFRNSVWNRFSHSSHSSIIADMSMIPNSYLAKELSTRRLTGTRLACLMKRWPSAESR